MHAISSRGRTLGYMLDVAIVFIGFVLTDRLLMLFLHESVISDPIVYLKTFLFTVFSWLLSLLILARYPSRRAANTFEELAIAVRVNVAGVIIFGFLTFVLKAVTFSRLYMGAYVIVCTLLMVILRYGIRSVLYTARHSGRNYRTRIIVGAGPSAAMYLDDVENHRHYGIRVLGYVSAPGETGKLQAPYLGGYEAFSGILANHPVEGVVITLPMANPYVDSVVHACDVQGVSVEIALDGLWSRVAASEIVHGQSGSRLLLSAVPHSSGGIFLKRLTDVVVSGVALVVLSPIFLVIAALVKVEDGGPVFFSQPRVGRYKTTFTMHKFRSMRPDAEALRSKLLHLNEMSGPVFKLRDDPRVTRVGRILRSTSLDELPQLWNIFVGDMSLVGPRPPLPSEVKEYEDQQRRRLSVKPGLTCLWQISGRNEIDFDEWMELDLQYIDNWSYFRDLGILFKTVPAVLRRHGAS